MINKFTTNVVCFFIIYMMNGCATNYPLCKSTQKNNSISYSDPIYNKLLDVVNANFFYSKKDSTYVQNFTIYSQVFYNDFYSTLQVLNQKEIVSILGEPHFQDDTKIGYILKKLPINETNGSTSVMVEYFTFSDNHFKNIYSRDLVINEEIARALKTVYLKNRNNVNLKHIRSNEIKLSNQDVSELCYKAKIDFANYFYFDEKANTYIYNGYTEMPFIARLTNCDNSFSRKEIISLLGNPHLENANELFYKLTNKPFYQFSPNNDTKNNGKTYCICFNKSSNSNYYQFGMKYEQL